MTCHTSLVVGLGRSSFTFRRRRSPTLTLLYLHIPPYLHIPSNTFIYIHIPNTHAFTPTYSHIPPNTFIYFDIPTNIQHQDYHIPRYTSIYQIYLDISNTQSETQTFSYLRPQAVSQSDNLTQCVVVCLHESHARKRHQN